MNVSFCDKCDLPIPSNKRKWVIAIKEVIEEESETMGLSIRDISERRKLYENSLNKIISFEICEACKNIWDIFFALRKLQMLKLKKEFEKLDI